MLYRALADFLVIIHFLFVAFVLVGGFVAWRWHGVAWLHLPAAVWGVAIELGGWVCPLTPLENALRARAGLAGYPGGFVEHHMLAWLYPAGLTPQKQIVLGALALLVNLAAYGVFLRRQQRQESARLSPPDAHRIVFYYQGSDNDCARHVGFSAAAPEPRVNRVRRRPIQELERGKLGHFDGAAAG